MNYSLFLLGLFVVLLIIFLLIKARESNLPVVSIETFGPKQSNSQLNKELKEKITEQKIAHKSFAFYAYVFSLIVTLILGCYFTIKVIQHLDFKSWQDALTASSGVLSTVSTISFKRLHDKCVKDLNNLK